jgi:hypothetical protein
MTSFTRSLNKENLEIKNEKISFFLSFFVFFFSNWGVGRDFCSVVKLNVLIGSHLFLFRHASGNKQGHQQNNHPERKHPKHNH